MKDFTKIIDQKIRHIMVNMIFTGTLLLILAILVAASDFMARLLLSVAVIVIAYSFYYAAYKLHTIKKIISSKHWFD